MVHPGLKRLDTHAIPADTNEIRLFCVSRNEALRLPYFLEHYRKLGVGRFFIISNASSDETEAFLLKQPDCCVFHTDESYAKARAGLKWRNSLLDEFGVGHWIILADADELLVYPHCEQKKLHQLCKWMEKSNYQGFYALLLDIYSEKPLNKITYRQGENFLSACNLFDRDYHFVRRMGVPFFQSPFPVIEPIGGPRYRLCFPRQNTKYLWPRIKVKISRRFLKYANRLNLFKNMKSENPAPQAFKIPLVKWERGYAYITSHRLNPVRLAPVTGALLHFKYFQDFAARVEDAISRKSHYDDSSEYKKYAELIKNNPEFTMTYPGSAVYRDSNDLVRHKLVKTDAGWG